MNPEDELFEKFGKQLIERVRDGQIQYADVFLDRKIPLSDRYKNELETLSPAQIEMLKKMVVRWIDGTLHDFLFLLEGADWIELHLKGQDVEIEDIRDAASGDLQGYVDIWAQKYSSQRLFEL